MSAYIKELKNKAGDRIYPVTRIDAVYFPDGKTRIEDEIQELKDGTSRIVFKTDGSIEKRFGSGKKSTTVFGDGTITETCKNADGSLYYTKITTFNADGSISTDMTFEEG